jgi:hypothetical protein
MIKLNEHEVKLLNQYVSTDKIQNKYFLNSWFFTWENDTVKVITIDGKAMMVLNTVDHGMDINFKNALNGKMIKPLSNIKKNEILEISLENDKLVYMVNGLKGNIEIIEGDFPKYQRFLPKKDDIKINLRLDSAYFPKDCLIDININSYNTPMIFKNITKVTSKDVLKIDGEIVLMPIIINSDDRINIIDDLKLEIFNLKVEIERLKSLDKVAV